jgi:hypothetical protein
MFEALTAVRPYKPCLTPHRAFEIMLDDPGAFDAAAFAALVRTVGLYPPGSRVLLDSGEEAFVLRTGAHATRPVVQVTHDPAGGALAESDRRTVDLGAASEAGVHVAQILLDDMREVEADPRAYAERPLTVVTQPPEAVGHAHPSADPCPH